MWIVFHSTHYWQHKIQVHDDDNGNDDDGDSGSGKADDFWVPGIWGFKGVYPPPLKGNLGPDDEKENHRLERWKPATLLETMIRMTRKFRALGVG